jgi:uncharacterized membrane protein
MNNTEQAPTTLYTHTEHAHTPLNVNAIHALEKATGTFNQRIAIWLTKSVGTMLCAYAFAVLAIIGFPGLQATPTQYVQWLSQTFIQLVMLSVIMVGQSVLGRKQELQSNEQYEFTLKSYHDVEEIIKHLDEQDKAILGIVQRLDGKHENPEVYDTPALFRVLDAIETHLNNTASSLEHIESTVCKTTLQNTSLELMLTQLEQHNKTQTPPLSKAMCSVLHTLFTEGYPTYIYARIIPSATMAEDRVFDDEVQRLKAYFKYRLESSK